MTKADDILAFFCVSAFFAGLIIAVATLPVWTKAEDLLNYVVGGQHVAALRIDHDAWPDGLDLPLAFSRHVEIFAKQRVPPMSWLLGRSPPTQKPART
jgi:hypothetical protein